jgi:4-amino-4-deoxy-L-arabinose transferase-like glycosyltransferase
VELMRMIQKRTTIPIAACLLLSATTLWLVTSGEGRLLTLLIHLVALGSGVAALYFADLHPTINDHDAAIDRRDLPLIGAVLLVQLVGLIYMMSFPFHYVQDEFITGHTSYTLPPLTEIEWFAGYPPAGEWIAGFPILYYLLQKPFIEVFGLSLETVRISTWPYHLLSAALVYLIGKELFQCRSWAVVGAMIYILLAPNLYMSGYGMHNISSTFFFLAALYSAVRMLRTDDRRWLIASGLFGSMAYLTYTSSYLTLPLISVLAGLWTLFSREWRPLIRLAQVTLIAILGLVPFLTHALVHDNYFTERGDQVNAVSTFYGDDSVENPATELLDHVWVNIQSLHTPGIGGVTDYWFGKQALFDWLTLTLLLAGIGIALYRGLMDRKPLELTLVVTVLATFVLGMLLTLPAGGFHRTTLAFPFIALLITLAIRTIVEGHPWLATRSRFQLAGTAILLLAFILINISTLQTMTSEDEQISGLTDSVPITAFIENSVRPDSDIVISAFPNYHLERELIVRTGDEYDVRIEPFDQAIDDASNAVLVLFQPSSDQIHRLEARYAHGTFIDRYDGRDLRRHLIWVPQSQANH